MKFRNTHSQIISKNPQTTSQNQNEWISKAKQQKSYCKLFGVRPGHLRELLDSDPAPVLEATLVDNIGGLLNALGDYVVGAEVIGGGLEVREGELRERPYPSADIVAIGSANSGRRLVGLLLWLLLSLVSFWVGFRYK